MKASILFLERHHQVWKRRSLLRHILVPDRCKLQDLPAGLEKCEELVRRYERSKSSGTTTTALGDDIKTAALELKPLFRVSWNSINRARLITYEQVRKEIQSYIKARRSQFAFKTVATKSTSDPMEVMVTGRASVRSPHLDHEGWLRWTYDTGAAISTFPLDARLGTEAQANDCSYETASGELMSDRGGLRVQGTNGTCIGNTKIQKEGSTRSNQGLRPAHERQQSEAFGTLEGGKSHGKRG